MFTITNLHLSNICQYDDLEVPINQGLMAVCGKNGCGKTTLLRGLMYGLTGLVDGSWGTQQSLQKDGSTVPGYVTVIIEDKAAGVSYEIKRYSSTGAKFPDSVLELTGGEQRLVAQRRKTVDAFLTDCFGISPALLFQLVWGRQGRLDQLLTAPAAYISTFLSAVFDMKHLETLRDRLKMSIDSIAVMADPMEEITSLAIEKKQLEDGLPMLLTNREAEQKTYDEAMARLADVQVRSRSEDVVRAKELDDLFREHVMASGRQSMMRTSLLQELDEVYLTEEPEEIQRQIAEKEKAMSDTEQMLATAKQNLQEAQNALGLFQSRTAEAAHNVQMLRSSQETLEALKPLPGGFCRLCEHAIDDNHDIYERNINQICGFDPAKLAEAEAALTICTEEEEGCKGLISSLMEQVRDLTEAHNLMHKQHHTLQCLLNYINEERKLAANRARQEELKASGTNQEDACELREAQRQVETCKQRLDAAKQALTAAETRIAVIGGTLDRLEQEKEQYEINAQARQLLGTLRDVFSQQRAQARYFASKITTLNVRLQEFMEATGMPFSLKLNPDTRTFDYTSADGYQHPACHLSGAQKNISAVALQMALVEVIQPNINLFLFDEPSEALDVENKYIMAEMFKKMNRLLPSIGGTMLIVSRDEQLIESCENVITIS